jgi:serine/threonine protein kinase
VSKNCKVIFGIDLQNDRPVALKLMSNKSQFRREIEARITRNREPIMNVIKLLCWHCPASDGYSDTTGREPETEVSEVGSYVVVMARGERSLHESVAKERFAGYDVPKVIAAASSIAHALCELHQHGMIHCDIKQRNLVRVASGEYALIDLDGSAAIGDQCGWKSSTAYIAPELARARFNTAKVEVGCVENSGGQVQ